ncbi:MAG: aminopeptidase P family N-terminal domain-containing protein [Chloroflexi bacterium]|nr:aminopeptidase P family N-terminal domain-containing protein [Chloroflexota bacterium]
MKRGLMEWNRTEVPEEELANRLDAVRRGMARDNLDAILALGDSYETGDLNYLTNFSPYWFNAMLVLAQSSDSLVTTLNARVHGWIKEVSRAGELKASKNLGRDAAAVLAEKGIEPKRIGVTRLDRLPYGVYQALREALPDAEVVDATALVESLRLKPSESQIGLLRRAAAMSLEAIAAETAPRGRKQCEVAADIEHRLRYAGAEDLHILITSGTKAANWPAIAKEEAIEGPVLVRAIAAYKGHWAEVGRTLDSGSGANKAATDLMTARFQGAVAQLRPGVKVGDVVAGLVENRGYDYRGICAVAPYTALPDIEGEWSVAQVIPEGAVVVLRAGLISPEGIRAFQSDTFLVGTGGAERLS